MINTRDSNLFAVKYKLENETKIKYFACESLLEITGKFHRLQKNAKIISIALVGDCTVLNPYDVNILESIS